ncbi:hypothetical protein MMYC01_201301 [Madurella mycetomatis]|uniref:Uncharacterized protein n=1 Tax=Madurella mycetomatis TaxID=100816 RepID=A0A175WF85_9PEZI|nr:hypothetical protein MMYC01_201301 [Madurella mycetomatis]
MAAGATTVEGIPAVVDQAVLKLECIKEARAEICGATEPLGGIVDEANCLINALNLVKEVDSFQTREIGREARGIVELSALLIASMLVMSAESRHRIQPRELQPQDHEYHHLEAMLGQLREARKTLENSMTAAYVGLQGNSQDGFQVSRKRLVDANERIKKVFGVDTLVYIRLQDQLSAQAADIIKLDDADANRLGLPQVSSDRIEEWRAAMGE